MIDKLYLIFSLFVFILTFSIIFFIVGFILTKKFNNKYLGFYSIFFDLNKRESFLLACSLLNYLLIIFFTININYYSINFTYLIIITSIFFALLAFNIQLILSDIFFSLISIVLIWVLNLLNKYLIDINFTNTILILKIILIVMIIIYATFVIITKINMILKIRRKKMERKVINNE